MVIFIRLTLMITHYSLKFLNRKWFSYVRVQNKAGGHDMQSHTSQTIDSTAADNSSLMPYDKVRNESTYVI